MQNSKTNILLGLTVGVLVASSFFVGFFVGAEQPNDIERVTEASNKSNADVPVDFSPFWKTWRILNEKHIDANEIESEDKLWSSIQGLTDSFDDPYTVFFPPREAEEFEIEISGNFEGVGMEVGIKDDVLTVVAPLKGTPADESGVMAGDKILEIDGESTRDLTVEEAVDIIRGERGTEVTLTIYREGVDDSFDISITRGVINIPTLDTELRQDDVFVISLYNFSANAVKEFEKALVDFNESGSSNLVVDLRGNPGGFLQASIEIASYFLPSGEIVVREVGKGGEELEVFRSRGYNVLADREIDIVVLVDQGSASASEILAGALSEAGVATLVGRQTFGKGTVQEVVEITPETSLKVTIAEWLTPDGVSISENGLTPDVVVEWEPNEGDPESDNQLDRAVEILLNN